MTETLRIPVLLGGPGHGMPIPDGARVVYPIEGELGELDELDGTAMYVEHKWGTRHATLAVRFMALDTLPQQMTFALAWDWLVNTALSDD